MDAASRVYQGCGPLAPADQPPILAPSCLRLAFSVRISGKFAANHATFPPHDNSAISTAYNLRTKSSKSTGSERIGPRRAIFGLFLPWPVNRSAPKTPGILPSSGGNGRAERADQFETGGEGGIRTHGTVARTSVFETDPFDRSGTSPAKRGSWLPRERRPPIIAPACRRNLRR